MHKLVLRYVNPRTKSPQTVQFEGSFFLIFFDFDTEAFLGFLKHDPPYS